MKKQKPPVKRIAEIIVECQRIYLQGILEQNKRNLEALDKTPAKKEIER